MNEKTFLAFGLVIGLLVVVTGAPAAETPSVDSILTKYVAALGGKAAMEKVTSRVVKIKMQSEMMGTSEGEVYSKAPNKQWSQFEFTGSGTMNEGFDGTVAWAKTPWEGLRVKAGDELAKVKRDSEFQRELKFRTLYPDLAYKGTEKVEGEDACVLEAKPTPTSKERFAFSAKTGLLVRQDSEFEGPQGQVTVTVLPQDYKPVDGIKVPQLMKLKISTGGGTFEFTLNILEVKQNVKIDDAKFSKPAA